MDDYKDSRRKADKKKQRDTYYNNNQYSRQKVYNVYINSPLCTSTYIHSFLTAARTMLTYPHDNMNQL